MIPKMNRYTPRRYDDVHGPLRAEADILSSEDSLFRTLRGLGQSEPWPFSSGYEKSVKRAAGLGYTTYNYGSFSNKAKSLVVTIPPSGVDEVDNLFSAAEQEAIRGAFDQSWNAFNEGVGILMEVNRSGAAVNWASVEKCKALIEANIAVRAKNPTAAQDYSDTRTERLSEARDTSQQKSAEWGWGDVVGPSNPLTLPGDPLGVDKGVAELKKYLLYAGVGLAGFFLLTSFMHGRGMRR